ncbi:MAG TPA: hypothetical protein PL041_02335 [Melioribacteraceae bacterium]|nr:hypothetical protein [Melioribacteraceae bacterium]HPN37213.1 hypothetical protein [Melioribacteraceae bacterium]
MKTMKSYLVKVMMVVLLTTVVATNANAQEPLKLSKRQSAIENLKMAINSENTGLRRSGYELCGKLRYKEILPELIKASQTEEDDYLQFVLALTLLDYNTKESNVKAEELLMGNETVKMLSSRMAKVD